MKVFRFYLEWKSDSFKAQGKQYTFITCCVIYCSQVYTGKCGVLFICARFCQNLHSDKRLTPHFLFVIKCHSWGWNAHVSNMRFLSFIIVIIGSCLAFSGEAEVLGGILIAVGVLMNIIFHVSNIGKRVR